jgi:hypothetical protein
MTVQVIARDEGMPMTDQGPGNTPPAPAEQPPPALPPRRHPAVTALMMIIGLIALLPGICAITFLVAMTLPGGFFDGGVVALWLFCFAISAGGIMLIRAARRQPASDKSIT